MDYDTAIKKLINILKFKSTTDGLNKQIEDLWDSVNTQQQQQQQQHNVKTVNNINNENSNSNTSNTSSTSINSEQITSKTKRSATTNSQEIQNSKKQKLNPINNKNNKQTTNDNESTRNQSINEQTNIKIQIETSNLIISESPNSVADLPVKSNDQISKIDDYAVDMGFTCHICQ